MLGLILARHGDFAFLRSGEQLTEKGRQEIAVTANKLKKITEGFKVLLISSTAPRAKQSSEIIARELGLKSFGESAVITSDGIREEDPRAALGLVRDRAEDAEIIILVTHGPFVLDLVRLFGKEVLGVNHNLDDIPPTGSATVISCTHKTFDLISP
ncbi:MAG: histidine phosphatase family protein [bacterium]